MAGKALNKKNLLELGADTLADLLLEAVKGDAACQRRVSKAKPARYGTTNWSTYNDALRKRGALLIWLDKEMAWHAPNEGRQGRPPVFSNAAIQFCLSIKVLFKLPFRQTAGMVASLLRLAGLDWPVPDCSPLCLRQKTLKVQTRIAVPTGH